MNRNVLFVMIHLLRQVKNSSDVVSRVFLIWFLSSENVPSEFVYFTPHITTLIVLSSASQKLRMPQKIGQPYRKGELN